MGFGWGYEDLAQQLTGELPKEVEMTIRKSHEDPCHIASENRFDNEHLGRMLVAIWEDLQRLRDVVDDLEEARTEGAV